jgi:hypothetical protein
MRQQMFLALALAAVGGFTLANCGGGSNNSGGDMGGPDLAGGGGAADMALPKLNCLGIGNCTINCIVANPMMGIDGCFSQCSKQGKVGSAAKWQTAFICGQNYCAPPSDMAGKCVRVANPADMNQVSLCDPGQTYAQCTDINTPPGVCSKCLANARNLILADFSTDPPGPPTGTCPDGATYPDCKGGATCTTMMNACIMDM